MDKSTRSQFNDVLRLQGSQIGILPVENIGVWRGDGIFEAIRIHGGYLFALDKHIERFKSSAKKMYFDNINFSEIEKDLIKVASNYETGYVRVIIGRGASIEDFNVYIFHQEPVDFPDTYSLQSQKAHWMAGGDFSLEAVSYTHLTLPTNREV